jgi:hypothetical protein
MAAWILDAGGKLPPDISMDNVTFYRKHQAAIQKLRTDDDSATFDEGESDDSEEPAE